jgi:hypothetical protein
MCGFQKAGRCVQCRLATAAPAGTVRGLGCCLNGLTVLVAQTITSQEVMQIRNRRNPKNASLAAAWSLLVCQALPCLSPIGGQLALQPMASITDGKAHGTVPRASHM